MGLANGANLESVWDVSLGTSPRTWERREQSLFGHAGFNAAIYLITAWIFATLQQMKLHFHYIYYPVHLVESGCCAQES
jgi:hypothetical protein